MGPIQKEIQARLEAALTPERLVIENESHLHEGHAHMGPETHFRVFAVSKVFEGLKPVQRHRLVHGALDNMLQGKIHALTLSLFAPDEPRKA
ncbi:MAG TPA: BolA family protein [Bdellovibrionales bacterium]|nr:BolA family protein [Bdellovibrionales bacterium]